MLPLVNYITYLANELIYFCFRFSVFPEDFKLA